MLSYLAMGILLGLSAGLSPGPLLVLVLSETLAHGRRAGLRVSLAPLLTDIPIIAVSLIVLSRLSASNLALGGISVAGAALILRFGLQSLRTRPHSADYGTVEARSLRKGVLVNFLSPHPYLFWMGIGGPAVVRAAASDVLWSAAFVAGFYAFLVGSKMTLAMLTGRSRGLLSSRGYLVTMRLLGLLLIVFAVLLARDGIDLIMKG
jgi:threonine/homoserine/homoserine lactone efflux protein